MSDGCAGCDGRTGGAGKRRAAREERRGKNGGMRDGAGAGGARHSAWAMCVRRGREAVMRAVLCAPTQNKAADGSLVRYLNLIV